MFTTYDKALVALLMAVIFFANNLLGFHFALSQDAANTIAAVVTPLIVYLVPNKPKES